MIHAHQPPTGTRRPPRRRVPPRLLVLCAAAGLIPAAAWFVLSRPATAPVSDHATVSASATTPPARAAAATAVSTAGISYLAEAAPAAASLSAIATPLADPAATAPSATSALEDFRRRAAADPAAAARWLAAQPTLSASFPWLEQLALAWTERDPDAALRWVREHAFVTSATPASPAGTAPTDLRSALLLTVAGELVRTRPLDALRAALDAAPSPTRDAVLRRAAADWATRDALAATAWTWEITDPALRSELLTSVIVAVADADPATALIMAEDDLGPGRARDDVFVSIFQRWAQNDLTQARARWMLLPDGQVKNAAARSLGFAR